MTPYHAPVLVLSALLDLARAGRRANAASLGLRARLSLAQVADSLAHLEARGLVDARGCRLTLGGLAVATSLAAQAARVGDLARVA